MKIELQEIPIRDLYNGYVDNDEEGVVGYDGQLNIRPKYQREFVYADSQRDEVVRTVRNGFPLNTMYWVKVADDQFELLDGQQRTISICQYLDGVFSIDHRYFHNLTKDEQEQILDYELMVYVCEGTDKDQLEWFRVINIAGEALSDQELRNAIYTGAWLTDAKRFFSKTGAPAYDIGSKLLKGKPIRQDYLETVLEWSADKDGVSSIEEYMAQHQNDKNANALRMYFQSVVNWVNTLFPKENYRKEMKGIDWGLLYNTYHTANYDADDIEAKVSELMLDDEIGNNKGVYTYIFTEDDKHLNLRSFTPKQKRQLFEAQHGVCTNCNESFAFNEMEADHITPWSEGGKTDLANGQMLCKSCNRRKSNK